MTEPNFETYIAITGSYEDPCITYVSRSCSRDDLEADIGMIVQVDSNFRSHLSQSISPIRYASLNREWECDIVNGNVVFGFELLTRELNIREPLSNWFKSLTEVYSDGTTRLLEYDDWVIQDCTFCWDRSSSGVKYYETWLTQSSESSE